MADGPDDIEGPDLGDNEIGWAAADHATPEPAPEPTAEPMPEPAPGSEPEPALMSSPPPGVPATPPPPAPPAAAAPPPGFEPTPFAPPLPGTPPRRRGRGWVVVLVAALGVIVLALIAGTVLFIDRTQPPYDTAHAFVIDHLIDGDVGAAARLLCASDQDDAEQAVASVYKTLTSGSSFGGRTEVAVSPFGVDRSDNVATVKYSVDPSVGPTRNYELPLREEGGAWTVCPGDGVREVDG